MALDGAALFLAFLLAASWTGGMPAMAPGGVSFRDFPWMAIVFLIFLGYEGLYVRRLPLWDEIKLLSKAVTTASMLVGVMAVFAFRGPLFLKTVFFLWIFGMAIVPAVRVAGKRLLGAAGLWGERVIIMGAGEEGVEAARGILADRYMGYEITGFLDSDPALIGREIDVDGRRFPVLDALSGFRKYVNPHSVGTVVIALTSLPPEKLAELTNVVQRHVPRVLLVPPLKGISLLNTELQHLFSKKLYVLNIRNSLKNPFNRFAKEAFDIVISLLLLPLALPLIALLGLLIRAESPGPVFFTHERVGRNGRRFRIVKFRSMYADSQERLAVLLDGDPRAREEWSRFYKLKDDPRVTRIGRFLRRTSLDELPQIVNVLKREMSLVGPRPVLQEEIDNFYGMYADYYFMVRPGITGLWQVSGRSDIGYELRVKLDAWYVMNWSLWFDVVILLKTIPILLGREGAY